MGLVFAVPGVAGRGRAAPNNINKNKAEEGK